MKKKDDQYLVMKCLFCGNDLPLLKRFGGAEFCSDEHRQQYQQEYSELALSRLAQHKSPTNKAALPVKPAPAAEQSGAQHSQKDAPKDAPKEASRVSPQPSMKLTEAKADPKKMRPAAEAKASEPKLVATPAPAPKPALVTKTSRPLMTPASVSPPLEPASRAEPKKLSITPPGTKPTRSVVPLQETKPLRVTETKVPEAKGVEAKPTEVRSDARAAERKPVESTQAAPVLESARAARPSAHAPLRLELPVGLASTRLAPERRLIPTPEVPRPIQKREPAAIRTSGEQAQTAHGELPVIEEAAYKIEEAAYKIEEAALKIEGAAVKDAVPREIGTVTNESAAMPAAAAPEAHDELPVIEEAAFKIEEAALKIQQAALKIEEAAVKETGAARREAGETIHQESARAREAAPEVAAPAPLAGLERSQPPFANWEGALHASGFEMAGVAAELPRGGIRPRPAALNGATHLSSGDILNPWAPPFGARPVRLEIREFARMEPIIEFKPIMDAPYVPAADQTMEVSFHAAALQAEPKLWAEPAREFGIWLDPREYAAFLASLAAECHVLKDGLKDAAAVPAEAPSIAAPPERSSAGPNGKGTGHAIDLSREPQPVTLGKTISAEGVPGGKAKPVQMFTSTLRESVHAAVPYYDALPLRATILVGRANDSAPVTGGNGRQTPRGGEQ